MSECVSELDIISTENSCFCPPAVSEREHKLSFYIYIYIYKHFHFPFFSTPHPQNYMWVAFNASSNILKDTSWKKVVFRMNRIQQSQNVSTFFEMHETFYSLLHCLFFLTPLFPPSLYPFLPPFLPQSLLLCSPEWCPCTGVASKGEPVKHLLQALQFCIILESTEPVMLGL